ncbi:hypothetical protein ABKN59_010146 [Abortiporus biennis]
MDEPPFLSVGEAVEFFRQIIEGVQFMHHHHIAHRDVMKLNIMMDPNPMTVPEFQPPNQFRAHVPLPTDIYYLGNMIRMNFLRRMHGFGFMKELIEDMVQDDPKKRPTIDEVAKRFEIIQCSLSLWNLRSRPVPVRESVARRIFESVRHIFRTCGYIYHGIDAIPRPSFTARNHYVLVGLNNNACIVRRQKYSANGYK